MFSLSALFNSTVNIKNASRTYSQLLLPTFRWLNQMGRAKRICYLSPMRAAKVQASLRIRAVSPEPSLLAHTSSESRGTFRQKARSVAPLNGWACAVKICHDGMLEDTNSLDGAQMMHQRHHIVINYSFLSLKDIRYLWTLNIANSHTQH